MNNSASGKNCVIIEYEMSMNIYYPLNLKSCKKLSISWW